VLNGEGHVDLVIDFLNLNPSRYYLSLLLRSAGGNDERDLDYDILENCIAFDIEPSNYYASGRGIDSRFGLIFLPCRWESDLLVDANF
jgi:hypothetical protein